jgi:cytidine deaminase
MPQDDAKKRLFEAGLAAMNHAYAPYSRFTVGAALATADGVIHNGCNVETANYKGICAEGTAIVKMVSAGGRLIRDIAVIGPNEALCTPCGDCRQRIREFADAGTRIHVFARSGILLKTYTMNELLPDSFGPETLTEA